MLFVADTRARIFYANEAAYPMAIGRAGAIAAAEKREGDGKTPLGRYNFEHGYYRADRLSAPKAGVALHPSDERHGWCDAPEHPSYNQPVTLPFDDAHERLVREDALYDLVFVLSHNRWPTAPHYGSAIFMHLAKEDAGTLKPTEGCIALRRADLVRISPYITRRSWLIIR